MDKNITITETKITVSSTGSVTTEVSDKLVFTTPVQSPSFVGSTGGTVTQVTATPPLNVTNGGTTPALTISKANSTTDGYLGSTDWNLFNNKQNTLSQANSISDGYLSSSDWSTFNNKHDASIGAVPVGGMIVVMPNIDLTNAWQPPASGVIKDGFMRADGTVITQTHRTNGCKLALGTVLPSMMLKYPKGGTTSGTTGGNNTYTPTGTVSATGLSFVGAQTSYSVSVPSHYHSIGNGSGLGGGEHGHNIIAHRGTGAPFNQYVGNSEYESSPSTVYNAILPEGSGHNHSGTIGHVNSGRSGDGSFTATGTNTPSGSVSGTATLTGTSVTGNNEPSYIEVIWVIRVF